MAKAKESKEKKASKKLSTREALEARGSKINSDELEVLEHLGDLPEAPKEEPVEDEAEAETEAEAEEEEKEDE